MDTSQETWRRWLWAAALAGGLGACAGSGDPLALEREVTALKTRLDESQRRQGAVEHKLEEMEDRVFLLTDQLESEKVKYARNLGAPKLPVVTLRPQHDAEVPPVERGFIGQRGPDGSVTVDDGFGGEIEYRGDAARRGQPVIAGAPPPPPKRERPRELSLAAAAPPLPKHAEPRVSPGGDNLGVAPAPDVAKILRAAPAAGESKNPLREYRLALEVLRGGEPERAAEALREFLRRWPRHDYADNAQYWLGECFYSRRQWKEASDEFGKVVRDYPLGNKAPDAMVKLALCALNQGDLGKAKSVLAQVPTNYPHTEAARVAEERLRELGRKEGQP